MSWNPEFPPCSDPNIMCTPACNLVPGGTELQQLCLYIKAALRSRVCTDRRWQQHAMRCDAIE
eukprot:1673892-Alexandrium_andersonii.AAC.1